MYACVKCMYFIPNERAGGTGTKNDEKAIWGSSNPLLQHIEQKMVNPVNIQRKKQRKPSVSHSVDSTRTK